MASLTKNQEERPPVSRNIVYAIGVAGLLLIEFLARHVILPQPPPDMNVCVSLFIEWAMFFVFIVYWVPKVERNSMDSLGVTSFRWRHLVVGIEAYVLAFVPLALTGYVLDTIGLSSLRSLQPTLRSYQVFTLIGLFLTGPILEEFLYRGYLIERLTSLLGRRWLAGLVSWLAFTVVHYRLIGLGPMVEIGGMCAVLVLLYLRQKSVWPCVVFHGVNSALAYLIFPLLVS